MLPTVEKVFEDRDLIVWITIFVFSFWHVIDTHKSAEFLNT